LTLAPRAATGVLHRRPEFSRRSAYSAQDSRGCVSQVLANLRFKSGRTNSSHSDATKLPPAPPSAVVLSAIKAIAESTAAQGRVDGKSKDDRREQLASQSERLLVLVLNSDPEACRRIAASVDTRTAEAWSKARRGAEKVAAVAASQGEVNEPTRQQMLRLYVRNAVPFVGFGFFDNMIMLTVGGAIENTIGVAFGLTSLAAAGMGQMVSDASGITLQGLIERFADRLGLPHPRLSLQQQQLRSVQAAMLGSRIFGIVFGCCLGMFPLLFLPDPSHRHLAQEIADRLPKGRREEFLSSIGTRSFKDGEKILRHGEMSNYVLFIEEGHVQCVGRDADGLPFQVCVIEAGHSFGKPQLHCVSRVDLIADGDVVVEYMEKDNFVRVSGSVGIEVWENTRSAEHAVYFNAQGHRVEEEFIAPAVQGVGKTRTFAKLPQMDKLAVLKHVGGVDLTRFQGRPKEGKCTIFASLPEDVKHDALEAWHKAKFGSLSTSFCPFSLGNAAHSRVSE